jgi:hypothetical protein
MIFTDTLVTNKKLILTTKNIIAFLIAIASITVFSQEISFEEMQMLDQYRAQYAAKGVQLTPDDEVKILQRMRALKGVKAPNKDVKPPRASAPSTLLPAAISAERTTFTEVEIMKRVDDLPPGKPLSSFEILRDGLVFDNQRFADSDGEAKNIVLDPTTSTAAYLIPGIGFSSLKITRLGGTSASIVIGKLISNNGRTAFQSATGKSISGDFFIPTTDGIIAVRDTIAFRYVVGEGNQQVELPNGWSVAPLQRGNIATTGWILLEKNKSEEDNNPLNTLIAIGQLIGVTKPAMDYALLNLNNKVLVPLEVSFDINSTASYSLCKLKNGAGNSCDQLSSYDAVWRNDGKPNFSHYFWSIDWQLMNGKPIAVVLESRSQKINAYDLSEKKKVNLYENTLGITGYRTELSTGGKYKMIANTGIEKMFVDDIYKEVSNRPNVPSQP